MSAITLVKDEAVVTFDDFGLDSYQLFLRAKQLPEKHLAYDWKTGAYRITTPSRFAGMLDPSLKPKVRKPLPLADHLFDYQRFLVEHALTAKRYAIWADTGLGKTAMFLEFARQVEQRTRGKVLILSPLGVIPQTVEQARTFYGDSMPIEILRSRERLEEWCHNGSGIAISNYEKLIDGVMDSLRRCAGLILDESSILKSGGGVIKWNLIKSARGIEYKLSCTATPAPNDTMEYASQAAFLEKLRSEGEILWTYFTRDKKGDWRVKPHARQAFYRFMASWSIYLRDPAHYGFADILASLPAPEIIEERLALTPEQGEAMREFQVNTGSGMFGDRLGVRERSKLSQIARGFTYIKDGASGRTAVRISSLKPDRVAELVRQEIGLGRPTIVWTTFDEETEILRERLSGIKLGFLTGTTPEGERTDVITRFQSGETPVLITKAQLAGYGLNLQHCRSMIFSGFDDSFERMYQAVRRAYRYGQTERVRVFIPYVPELEGMIFENVRQKESRFMEEAGIQEDHYRAAMGFEAAA